MPLLDRHVRSLDVHLDRLYRTSTSETEQRSIALAGTANLFLWLGWLRSSEVFGLRWCNVVDVTPPDEGPSLDLPQGIGAVSCRLQPETKSSRDRTADCFIAFQTVSGYELGKWIARVARACHFHNPRHHYGKIGIRLDLPLF